MQGECITCPKNGNSTGTANDVGSCLCNNNYIWNPQRNTCVCDASVFAYITPSGACFSCMNFDDPALTGYVVNGVCECMNGFTFVTTSTGGNCQCSDSVSLSGVCFKCPPDSNPDGSDGCICLNFFIWSADSLRCLCDESVSSLLLPSGMCFSCV